jgi:uncharacterized protein YceH (UPF0502 family)
MWGWSSNIDKGAGVEILNAAEARVLGCLLEKQATTPEYYPLTLNYLVGACNQKTSREPVMELEEGEVSQALLGLRKRMLAVENKMHDSRVLKYSHNLGSLGAFSTKEQAALCLLLLRGPQTGGEIRGRSGRMAEFESVADAEAALASLAEKPSGPLAQRLPRRSGEKEARWKELMTGPAVAAPEESGASEPKRSLEGRVAALETQVQAIQEALQRLAAPPQA